MEFTITLVFLLLGMNTPKERERKERTTKEMKRKPRQEHKTTPQTNIQTKILREIHASYPKTMKVHAIT